MTDLFQEPDDATPITPEEQQDLIPTYVTTRAELNFVEQENIAKATAWANRNPPENLLSEDFLRKLHYRMFGDVWRWAGQFRQTERNIGIDPLHIAVELRTLLGNVRYWKDHNTYPRDETAIRFHHRLVAIHPFPNGNGRHARLIADLVIRHLGGAPFSWGGDSLRETSELRSAYISALRAADNHDIGPLLAFARG
jgi:Fic-DOC domain mobile mystery protein B